MISEMDVSEENVLDLGKYQSTHFFAKSLLHQVERRYTASSGMNEHGHHLRRDMFKIVRFNPFVMKIGLRDCRVTKINIYAFSSLVSLSAFT